MALIKNYIPKTKVKMYLQTYLNKLVSPVKSSSAQLSVIASGHDDVQADRFLLDLSLASIQKAFDLELSDIAAREASEQSWVSIYPGEHYKLLGGIMQTLQPKVIVELGTFLGQASLTMKKYMPTDAQLHTFDVIAWNQFELTCLRPEDFADGRLIQHTDDLTTTAGATKHKALLESADFVFIDMLKDGIQEGKVLEQLAKLKLKKDCVIMFDDIRVWNMVKFWRDVKRPKIDLTSFGHWSGTGLIHWNG